MEPFCSDAVASAWQRMSPLAVTGAVAQAPARADRRVEAATVTQPPRSASVLERDLRTRGGQPARIRSVPFSPRRIVGVAL